MSTAFTRNWLSSGELSLIEVRVEENGNTSLRLSDEYGNTLLRLIDAGGEWPVLREAIDALMGFAQEQAAEVRG